MTKAKPEFTIIKKSTCEKLLPTARGELSYHVGHDETAKTFHIRVTGNTDGGYFNKQWVGFHDIESAAVTPSALVGPN